MLRSLTLIGKRSSFSFVFSGAGVTFVLRILFVGLGFVTQIVLTRTLGVSSYGLFAYAYNWADLLLILTMLGFPNLLIRNLAIYREQEQWSFMRGLIHFARTVSLLVVFLVIGAALAVAWVSGLGQQAVWQSGFLGAENFKAAVWFTETTLWTIFLALAALPLMTQVRLQQAILQGMGHIINSQLAEFLLRPLLFLGLVVGLSLVLSGKFSASVAMGANLAAAGVALVYSASAVAKALPALLRSAPAVYQPRLWLRMTLPLLLISGMQIINTRTDSIMLGTLAGANAVGIYNVAAQVAQVITIVLTAVNVALAPNFARLYANGDMGRLQRLVTQSTRLILFGSVTISIGIIVFEGLILGVFGAEFLAANSALYILIVGRILNAASGSAGVLLTMTHNEGFTALGVGISAVTNIILNALFIPAYGIEGAALATTISMILWNVLLVIFARRRLGIRTTALGWL